MKIRYIRETKRSYMTVEPEGAEQQEDGLWEAGMLEENRIRGLLPMKVRYREGKALYCYDITSRQAGKSSGDCKGSSEPVLADIPDVGRDGGVSPEKRGYPFGAGADLCGAGML